MKKAIALAAVLAVVIFSNPSVTTSFAQDHTPPIQAFNHGSEY